MTFDTPITVLSQPSQEPDSVVIWLHGLGADGSDFVPAVPHLNLDNNSCTKFIFPQAPVRPVTVNGGFMMRAWYDILEMSDDREVNLEHLQQCTRYVQDLIDQEVRVGIAPNRIFVIGFSQGGAVAIHAALTYTRKLGGLVCLSTYVTGEQLLHNALATGNLQLPIFWGHGTNDHVVKFEFGERSKATLENLSFRVEWHDYAIGHEVSLLELRDCGSFLNRILNSQNVS